MAATGCHRSAQVTDVMAPASSVAEKVLVCIYSSPRFRVPLHIILRLVLRTSFGGISFSYFLGVTPTSNSCIYIIVLYIFFFSYS